MDVLIYFPHYAALVNFTYCKSVSLPQNTLTNGIVASKGVWIYNFDRYCQIVFNGVCTK